MRNLRIGAARRLYASTRDAGNLGSRALKRFAAVAALIILPAALMRISAEPAGTPSGPVPRSWTQQDVDTFRLPLAALGAPPALISEQEYYALPEVNLKTYPVYIPDKEPPGYLDWLKQEGPQPMVDVSTLKTEKDWIAAGREVFYGRELPRFTGSEYNLQLVRDPKILAAYGLQIAPDGVVLGLRYVVREKGKVELGTDTCAMCHVQVRPNAQVIEGAPNVHTPFGPLMADLTRRYAQISPDLFRDRRLHEMSEDYRVPFLKDDPNFAILSLSPEQIARLYQQNPLGSHARTNTSALYPVKIANLIGIQDMKYFDRTGTARNRNIRDLMRYSALIADSTDALTRYGNGPNARLNLEYMGLAKGVHRTPDALLYALALFIDSLKEPPNPNAVAQEPDSTERAALVKRGSEVFQANCTRCHTPPLYTNNRLTLAGGFTPSSELMKQVNAMRLTVGTDPSLALETRKGTGFYRVPSLRMVWLQACFLHDCSLGSLEEMFNPARLEPGFRSSNWDPITPAHAVNGHKFGLDLPGKDRTALIAFLKTL